MVTAITGVGAGSYFTVGAKDGWTVRVFQSSDGINYLFSVQFDMLGPGAGSGWTTGSCGSHSSSAGSGTVLPVRR